MSIYATLWELKLPKCHKFDDEWTRVYAQGVPPHIGHPSAYPHGDPYADFLPPIVMEYDPKQSEVYDFDLRYYRAVIILTEGHDEKIGQRYTSPLLRLTGKEYAQIPFDVLFCRIEDAMPWDRSITAMSILSGGQKVLHRNSEMYELLMQRKALREKSV